jgi:cellulose synthase/poly-beta-1,6-N-acetylglucosamine synthase-like glycosyltransferase
MKKEKQVLVTVGIPCRYTGQSLIPTIRSIMSSIVEFPFRVVVVADNKRLPKNMKQELRDMGVEIYENEVSGTQFKKLQQIVDLATGEVFVFTQDDVIFKPESLGELVTVFQKNRRVTMAGAYVVSTKASTFFERVIEVGVTVATSIGRKWNNADNYLLANGRCLAFRTENIKGWRLPANVVNGDGYLYLENIRHKGTFVFVPNAIIINNNPQNIREHLNQSVRFQHSQEELSAYFSSIKKYYQIPRSIIIDVVRESFFNNPFFTSAYFFIFVYSAIAKRFMSAAVNPFWQEAISTKRSI